MPGAYPQTCPDARTVLTAVEGLVRPVVRHPGRASTRPPLQRSKRHRSRYLRFGDARPGRPQIASLRSPGQDSRSGKSVRETISHSFVEPEEASFVLLFPYSSMEGDENDNG